MNAQSIMDEMERRGVVWLGGEMEFSAGLTCGAAYEKAAYIAEACGYMVGMVGASMLRISGGDIPGYVELDWYDGNRPGPECVRIWTAQVAYTSKIMAAFNA